MSLLVAIVLGVSSVNAPGTLTIEGEIFATNNATLVAPPIFDIWQLNIAELKPEGSSVKAGEVVLRLEVSDLDKQLNDRRNTLNEKQREREKLLLALSEREKSDSLSTAEAQAAYDKATRKAEQPAEVVRSIDYKKLVIDRARYERRVRLFVEREKRAAQQRAAELQLVDVEIARNEIEVERLTALIEGLAVKAPMNGMMLHRTNFAGEKFDVGSTAFMGLPIADIPDMQSLAVRAMLPEREFTRASVGARARVHVEGGAGATFAARVVAIGSVVRSKSRVQPIPIVELMLKFERPPRGLRPGQPVRIELDASTPANAPQ